MHFLRHLKVRTKINTGYVVTLVLLVLVASVAVASLYQINASISRLSNHLYRDERLTGNVVTGFLRVQAAAQQYYQHPETLPAYQREYQALTDLLTEARQQMESPDRLALLQTVTAALLDYGRTVEAIQTLIDDRATIDHDTLEPRGAVVEARLETLRQTSQAPADAARIAFLQVRIDALTYLTNGEAQHLPQFETHYRTLQPLLAQLKDSLTTPEAQTSYQELDEALSDYYLAFHALSADYTKQKELADVQLSALSRQILETASAIESSVTAELAAAQQAAAALAARAALIVLGGSGLALVAGAGLNYAISRSITEPLKQVTRRAAEVARGDNTRQLSIDSRDEIGELARAFNTMTGELHGLHAALQASEEQFRALLENSADVILVLAGDGNLRYASPAAERVLGYAPATLLGKPLADYLHPDDTPQLAALWDHARHTPGHAVVTEFRVSYGTSQPRRWCDLEVVGTDLLAQTAVGGLVLNLRDITERKQATLAVQAWQERFATIFRLIPEGITLSTLAEGRFVEVNETFLQMTGHTREDLVGRTFREVNIWGDTDERDKALSRLNRQGWVRWFETRLRRKSGEIFPALFSASLVDIAGEPCLLAAGLDITERKLAEEHLSRTLERLDLATRAARLGIWDWVIPRNELVWDEQMYALYGETKEKFAPTMETWLGSLHPDDRVRAEAEWRMALRGEKDYNTEFRIVCPDGAVRVLRAFGQVTRDAQGTPQRLTGVNLDITDRTLANRLIETQKEQLLIRNRELAAAEAEVRQVNSELEQRIQARSAELRAANEELQLANTALVRAGRLKDEFLANMSHELRTPLTGILGLAEVMDTGLYGELNAKQHRAMQQVQASGEHLLQLINDILDLSKIESGKAELQLAPVLVKEVCQSSLDFVKQMALRKNLQVNLESDALARVVSADGRRLKQMLVNLLMNAVKFTPEGGRIGLTVEGDAVERQVRFTVWDTGIGIPPEKQSLLFRPFVQLDSSLARKYEGAGLGLALVQSMAELHGGWAGVESAGTGLGSRFTITLPWTPEPAPLVWTESQPLESLAAIRSLVPVLGRPPVIVAVDDNALTLNVVTSFLEALDCRVLSCRSGGEALTIFADGATIPRPDLVVLDIQMPDIDGLTVIRHLRTTLPSSTLPIIALTALAMPEDRERCLAAGANDYLSKPVRLGELARTIAGQLEQLRPQARA
jgi:PAS domain S-box-containing protein